MKIKQSILLCLMFLLALSLKAQTSTNFKTPGAGWFKVGKWVTSQRGSDRITVGLNGGPNAPQQLVIDVFKNWSNSFQLNVKGVKNSLLQNVRITTDSNYYYLEVYFSKAIASSSTIHIRELEGFKSGFTINAGSLPVGGGTFVYETGNIVNKTLLGNTVDIRKDLVVNGNVGIGTTTPSTNLEIKSNQTKFLTFNRNGLSKKGHIGYGTANGGGVYVGTDDSTYSLWVQQNGNVGIGTYNPGAWKLAVNGKIRAKEIKVETGWADFVFYDDYKLPTLTEVENHIQAKGHLKDIPSAKEVAENGIFLGDMNAKLLQKIEELTLYTIQQEKKLEKQNSEIELLKKQEDKIKKLEEENKVLKSLLERVEKLEKASK